MTGKGKTAGREKAMKGRRTASDSKGATSKVRAKTTGKAKDRTTGLKQELAECKDRLLRKAAEFENYKKRTEREFVDFALRADADLMKALLPVLDDFDRSLGLSDKEITLEQFREGIELIVQKLHGILEERGLTPIEAMNREFDPEKHEALMQVESDGKPSNIVVDEHLRGYEHHGRVLRHSKVIVSK